MTTSPHSSSPLISAEALKAALGTVRVFDVRFDLARPEAGEAAWRELQRHAPDVLAVHRFAMLLFREALALRHVPGREPGQN